MTRREYTDRVLSGLRRLTGPEREAVRAELDAHMEDHICDLLDLGYDEALAEERTMQRMGDPEEVSRELNKQYPLRWLVLGRVAMALTLLLALFLVGPFFERVPAAWDSLQIRWAPRAVLDISQVQEDFDPLGLDAQDMNAEVTIRDVHFQVYQIAYEPGHEGGNTRMAVACWRTNPFQEELEWWDGYSLKVWVNGEEVGYSVQPAASGVSLYSVRAHVGDVLTVTWEVYGENGSVTFTLPEVGS